MRALILLVITLSAVAGALAVLAPSLDPLARGLLVAVTLGAAWLCVRLNTTLRALEP